MTEVTDIEKRLIHLVKVDNRISNPMILPRLPKVWIFLGMFVFATTDRDNHMAVI